MKRIFFYLFMCILFHSSFAQPSACLYTSGIVSNGCSSVGDPYIDGCVAGIQRQIARSVNLENIVRWNYTETCWGYLPEPPYDAQVNCDKPYNKCWTHYCPDKYCSMIKMMVDLKATMGLRAATPTGKEEHFYPGDTFFEKCKQLVVDINAAYDCAGLRRPVVQGTILENIEPGVNSLTIPSDVILAFSDDPEIMKSRYVYYSNRKLIPRTVNFDITNIVFTNTKCPDLSKLEARMWYYYVATRFIDLGYKSLHLGQLELVCANDPNFEMTLPLLTKIRNYAQQKNTFVLLTEENFKAKKIPGTNTFMMDFDTRALRPREITSAYNCGDWGCSNPVNTQYYQGTACENEAFPAYVDKCVLMNKGMSDGYSNMNNCYMQYMPYNTYFDFGPGDHPPLGEASSGCPGTHNNQDGTWGWDDTKWFANSISSGCREYFMWDAIIKIKDWHSGFGSMSAPGLITVKNPQMYDSYYSLVDESNVMLKIKKLWEPVYTNQLTVTNKCYNGMTAASLMVFNPDWSTVYTWHIQKSDGTWLPMTYGVFRDFIPPSADTYTIYLRQDNVGFPAASYPSGTKVESYTLYLGGRCPLARESNDSIVSREVPLSEVPYEVLNGSAYPDNSSSTPVNQSMNIKVHPNPSHGDWKVLFEDGIITTSEVTVQVYNSIGSLVRTSKITVSPSGNEFSIPNSDLSSGVYYIKIFNQLFDNNFILIKQ